MIRTLLTASALAVGLGAGAHASEKGIRITIENTIRPGAHFAQDPSPLTPVVYVIHRSDNPIFEVGARDRGEGLEVLAEDGATGQLVKSLKDRDGIVQVGVLDGAGLRLFNDDGSLMTGNVTDQISLWDAGTEVDETPGSGANQPPQAHNVGPAENGTVRKITAGVSKAEDGFAYPAVADHLRVTIEPAEMKKDMMSN